MATITGTTFKVNVSITEGLNTLTMDDIDFTCEFFCYRNRSQTITKDEMVRVDDSNYIAVVDSSLLGTGSVRMRLTATIPDEDCTATDGYRTEIIDIPTGINLYKV